MKAGTESSGAVYTTSPPACLAHVPAEPESSIFTNTRHGRGGASAHRMSEPARVFQASLLAEVEEVRTELEADML